MGDSIWQDKEVRFDSAFSQLKLRAGEKLIDRLDAIEDNKGNAGERGRLVVTNLRVMWHSLSSPRINLSIGFNCVLNANTRTINTKLRGPTEALYMLTKWNAARFEFIFTNMTGNKRHCTTVLGVHKAYASSRMYRELRLRASIIKHKQLQVLPLEEVFRTVAGVWNLSSEQGNLGTFVITNVRLVWFAEMNESFNISLPYLQMGSVKIRDSKFGRALVVESVERSGGYVLGFRLDPVEQLVTIHKEISSLHQVYSNNPIFGVEYSRTEAPEATTAASAVMAAAEAAEMEANEVTDCALNDMSNAFAAYFAEGRTGADREPVYNGVLGLAVEKPPEGFTLERLWEVIPSAQ